MWVLLQARLGAGGGGVRSGHVCDYSDQMRGPRGLSRHRSSGFKHLNNFNDDDRIIATHIYWELISAC